MSAHSSYNRTFQRAPFQEDLQSLRNSLPELIPILEAQSGWYGSVYFERKNARTLNVNLKQTHLSDQMTQGLVLRIYDGYTLFEQASDDCEPSRLPGLARAFADRVAKTHPSPGLTRRPYQPPTWKERLSAKLDPEITSQIPAQILSSSFPPHLASGIPVHFGIRFREDPKTVSTEAQVDHLKGVIARCQELAPAHGLTLEDLTFIMARQSFSEEESIFVDRESNLSQTLYRLALTVMTMSGSDRTFNRMGGLGGLEALEFNDRDIGVLLSDLKALKAAERLKPGKYRVLFGPVLTGVLAHEAFGHSQEADTCARGRSKAWDLHLTGEKVGNSHATILNNPAIFQNGDQPYAAWGSYFFDEEGWLAQEQVLLEEGSLRAPMTNLTSALRLGVPRTANGKRESWLHGVYTRQTNTYFSPGDRTLAELVAGIDDGFIATHPAGGMEDPKGMGIQVGISYMKEVKDGKLTGRVFKGPAGGDIQLTGYVPDVLNSIIAKSKIDFESSSPDESQHPFNDAGGCGKYHKEFVNAGCGGPYLLLDQVILG